MDEFYGESRGEISSRLGLTVLDSLLRTAQPDCRLS